MRTDPLREFDRLAAQPLASRESPWMSLDAFRDQGVVIVGVDLPGIAPSTKVLRRRGGAPHGVPERHAVTDQAPFPEWHRRLDDPRAPLYTMGVVADLLGVDQQATRRLDRPDIMTTTRPSGNQRRYSRNDMALLAYALELAGQGISHNAIGRIIDLERRVDGLGGDGPAT